MTAPAGATRRPVPAPLVLAAGFLAGSIPFANIGARRLRRVDLRTVGSGTVSGTNLYAVAGFGPLAVFGVCEVAKGAVGPLLAGRDRPALSAAAGGLAVAGHNWSPWLRGAGGRGISPAVGACLPQHWPGAALLLGGMAVGRLAGETAIGSLVADTLLVPVLATRRGPIGAAAGLWLVVPMVIKRLAGNQRPQRRRVRTYLVRLVYDRDLRARPEPAAMAAMAAIGPMAPIALGRPYSS